MVSRGAGIAGSGNWLHFPEFLSTFTKFTIKYRHIFVAIISARLVATTSQVLCRKFWNAHSQVHVLICKLSFPNRQR